MPKSKAFNDMYQLVKDNLPMDEIKAIRFEQIEKLKAAGETVMITVSRSQCVMISMKVSFFTVMAVMKRLYRVLMSTLTVV